MEARIYLIAALFFAYQVRCEALYGSSFTGDQIRYIHGTEKEPTP
jgi:hypothetical protein